MNIIHLDLPHENKNNFYYNKDFLIPIMRELEEFLMWDKRMDNLSFAKKLLYSHEIKANNQVEGYGYDVELINSIIKKRIENIKNEESKKHIINMYNGYHYILKHEFMDKDNLKELYDILSKDLLEKSDLVRMGKYYRTATVYIFRNGRYETFIKEGPNYKNIDYLMDKYFSFIENFKCDSQIEDYIKSQIMHFYFCYIHPYFDVNGRTSRTMALWHLIKTKAYPYIIFNRGISLQGIIYDNTIREATESRNLTNFLEMMLATIKVELEKEHIIMDIAQEKSFDIDSIEYQTLFYFLKMKGIKTAGDFAHMYNHYNDKKHPREIYKEMIEPLIDLDILKVERKTNRNLANDIPNVVLTLNNKLYDDNPKYLKRIKPNKY